MSGTGGIGIVGTGISGLQLALHLQQAGVATTVYAAEPVERLRGGRLTNSVVRYAPTLERERRLGVSHREPDLIGTIHVRVAGDRPLAFCGRLPAPGNTTDFRIYLPGLLEYYGRRGGQVVIAPCGPADLPALGERHELVVVAAGRDGFGGVFHRDPERSPYDRPQRRITVGLYTGVASTEPSGVEFTVIPGLGEIFQMPFHSFDGPVSVVCVEGVPGTPLADLSGLDYEQDPRVFVSGLLDVLHRHAPALHERIDQSVFMPTQPADLLQGGLTPVVRRNSVALGEGRHALALGDAWIVHDPIAAQGANLGSRCASVLGEMIAAGGPYDERFCRAAEQRLWAAAQAPTVLSNALLAPPPPHVADVLRRASEDQQVADRFCAGFGEPESLLDMLSSEPVLS
jgi:hypothetical protein